jgi:hypothetical protein
LIVGVFDGGFDLVFAIGGCGYFRF